MGTAEPLTIIELQATNIKRLKAFKIQPNGRTVIVQGKNGVGKTTALDLIEYALGGKGSIPAEPITRGETNGKIVVTTERFIITRKFKPHKTELIVTDRTKKAEYKSAQTMLSALYGDLSFDPLEFMRMDAKKQMAVLKNAIGIDFSEIEATRSKVYEERTDTNKLGKRTVALLESKQKFDITEIEEVSVLALTHELERRRLVNVDNLNLRGELSNQKGAVDEIALDIESMRENLSKKEAQLAEANRQWSALAKRVENLEDENQEEVQQQIGTAEEINKKVRANKEYAATETEIEDLRFKSETLTDRINGIDRDKKKLISDAKMPVPGIGFNEDCVTLNGLPLDQASGAEQLRLSTALGLALNPTLRVLLIRDASLLDEDGMKMIAQMAKKADAQLFLERVGSESEVTVVFEEGAPDVIEAPAEVSEKAVEQGPKVDSSSLEDTETQPGGISEPDSMPTGDAYNYDCNE